MVGINEKLHPLLNKVETIWKLSWVELLPPSSCSESCYSSSTQVNSQKTNSHHKLTHTYMMASFSKRMHFLSAPFFSRLLRSLDWLFISYILQCQYELRSARAKYRQFWSWSKQSFDRIRISYKKIVAIRILFWLSNFMGFFLTCNFNFCITQNSLAAVTSACRSSCSRVTAVGKRRRNCTFLL